MLLKIPNDKISKIDIINVRGGITASSVYKKYKPDYMINLALYDMASGENITNMIDEGIASGYLFTDEGIGIKGENKLVFSTKSDKTLRDFVAGSPILSKNGEKAIDWGNKYSEYVDGAHIRSSTGFNDKEVILYASDKEITLNRLADTMIQAGCDYAINLDGGGSSHLQEGEKIYRKSIRKNASWLLIYLKKEVGYIDYGGFPEVKKMKICLDAGHGISTAGKRSPDGSLLEYEFNRDVTLRLKKILEEHGVEVILTAYDDVDVPLDSRCKYANANDADYFVSVHANAYGDGWNDANGWEIYVVAKGGKAEKLAECIRKYSIKDLGLKDRGVKVGNFQVLRDTDMPAVLIEHGFYTNKEECEKLKSDKFRQKCAECDAKGIFEYLGIAYNATTTDADMVLTIDKKEYLLDGVKKTSDVAPKIENGRTLVPIYLLRELGLKVEWNADRKEVSVWKSI